MAKGNIISIGTFGQYVSGISSASSSDIPGPKTELTLKERATSISSTGRPLPATPVTVQVLSGVLTPISTKEKLEFMQKTGITASYAYYVSPSQFTSTANEAKLVEKNVLTSSTQTYEIVGKEDNTHASRGKHYKLLLEVVSR